jgi:hypothetical protein
MFDFNIRSLRERPRPLLRSGSKEEGSFVFLRLFLFSFLTFRL